MKVDLYLLANIPAALSQSAFKNAQRMWQGTKVILNFMQCTDQRTPNNVFSCRNYILNEMNGNMLVKFLYFVI